MVFAGMCSYCRRRYADRGPGLPLRALRPTRRPLFSLGIPPCEVFKPLVLQYARAADPWASAMSGRKAPIGFAPEIAWASIAGGKPDSTKPMLRAETDAIQKCLAHSKNTRVRPNTITMAMV
jgi:hypothetical protein